MPQPVTTCAGLLETARRHLLSGAPETLNAVATGIDGSSTSLVLARELRNIAVGSVLSVGLESLYVWTITDAAAKTVEVQRGYGGSTAAAHSAGDLVHVSPPHTDFAIFTAMNEEMDALTGAGLYAMRTLDLTTSTAGVRTYDLTGTTRVLDVYEVAYDSTEVSNTWPMVDSWTWRPSMPTSEFPSGNMLRLDSPVQPGRPLRVLYKTPLVHLATLADDVTAVSGLASSALDILPLGAVWRLAAPSEVERNSTRRQGDSRRAEEVPPGAKLRSSAGVAAVRAARIKEERANLERLWPERNAATRMWNRMWTGRGAG